MIVSLRNSTKSYGCVFAFKSLWTSWHRKTGRFLPSSFCLFKAVTSKAFLRSEFLQWIYLMCLIYVFAKFIDLPVCIYSVSPTAVIISSFNPGYRREIRRRTYPCLPPVFHPFNSRQKKVQFKGLFPPRIQGFHSRRSLNFVQRALTC